MYDVAIIGGGVVGGAVLRELAKFNLSLVMLEAGADVAEGASKANSGIAHAGFDAQPGTLKAKFNLAGSLMMEKLCAELGVEYRRNGSMVIAKGKDEEEDLKRLYERGLKNGVNGLSLISGAESYRLEPNLADGITSALLAEGGAIVCPYRLTIALIGNAMDNGAELFTNFKVVKARVHSDSCEITAEDGRTVSARLAVNCAGFGAQNIAALFGDKSFCLGARKGEYILLDKSAGSFVSRTIFSLPTKAGKGVLVSPTVDGNLLIGPTSADENAFDVSVREIGFSEIREKAAKICKNIPYGDEITSFAGVRAYSRGGDFIVGFSGGLLFNAAGIESPGLTSAPAIGAYAAEKIAERLGAEKRADFSPERRPFDYFKRLSDCEKNAVIAGNPDYGNVVCRCENVSLGEIREAMVANPPATTLDGIKFRTRAGMGRCQGGFCQPRILTELAERLGIAVEKVTKNGKGSEILAGGEKWKKI